MVMPRLYQEPTVPIGMRLTVRARRGIECLAAQQGLTFSQYMRRLVADHLADHGLDEYPTERNTPDTWVQARTIHGQLIRTDARG